MLALFSGILFWFVTLDLSNRFYVISAHRLERLELPHHQSGRCILDKIYPCYLVLSHRRLSLRADLD